MAETATKFGDAQVKIWRRAYDTAPPPLEKSDPRYPGIEPFWDERIAPTIRSGERVLHGHARVRRPGTGHGCPPGRHPDGSLQPWLFPGARRALPVGDIVTNRSDPQPAASASAYSSSSFSSRMSSGSV